MGPKFDVFDLFDFSLNISGRQLQKQPVLTITEALPKVMSVLLNKIARHFLQKAASDPHTREKVAKVALGVAAETRQIVGESDRAYAAGRALRRAMQRSRDGQ